MVKTSRIAPSKRPILGRVFRRCYCYVLELTYSNLSREGSEWQVALTTQPLQSPQHPHQYSTSLSVMPGLKYLHSDHSLPCHPGEKQIFNEVIFYKNHSHHHHFHPHCFKSAPWPLRQPGRPRHAEESQPGWSARGWGQIWATALASAPASQAPVRSPAHIARGPGLEAPPRARGSAAGLAADMGTAGQHRKPAPSHKPAFL